MLYLHDDGVLLVFYPNNGKWTKILFFSFFNYNLKVGHKLWTCVYSLCMANPRNSNKTICFLVFFIFISNFNLLHHVIIVLSLLLQKLKFKTLLLVYCFHDSSGFLNLCEMMVLHLGGVHEENIHYSFKFWSRFLKKVKGIVVNLTASTCLNAIIYSLPLFSSYTHNIKYHVLLIVFL